MRLIGGNTRTEGRVEVYHNDIWGTVCDDYWDTNNAKVVCKELGFQYGEAQAKTGAFFGQGSGPIWLDDTNCTGSENRLSSCDHRGWGVENCGHHDDAGVICFNGT